MYCHEHQVTSAEFHDRYKVGKVMAEGGFATGGIVPPTAPSESIEVPITSLWVRGEDKGKMRPIAAVDEALERSMVAKGQVQPILAMPARDIGPGHYYVKSGFRRLKAAQRLGIKSMSAFIVDDEPNSKDWHDLRATEGPLAWGLKAQRAIDSGVPIDDVIHESHLPRTIVFERLAMVKEQAIELKRAEEHGKVLGRQEKARQEVDEAIKKAMGAACIDGCKNTPVGKFCLIHDSPKSRGLKLCLEQRCKVWIKPTMVDLYGEVHFCKSHRKSTFEAFPFHDRDGDPIWIGAGFKVTKVQDMEMSHVLNCILMLEKAARKRAEVTARGGEGHMVRIKSAEEKFLKEMPRYAMLIAEVKQRDACKLCKGGLRVIDSQVDPEDPSRIEPVINYCECDTGRTRKATDAIVAQSKGKSKAAILMFAMAFVTALLNAPAASTVVMEFLHGVHERLKAMGVL